MEETTSTMNDLSPSPREDSFILPCHHWITFVSTAYTSSLYNIQRIARLCALLYYAVLNLCFISLQGLNFSIHADAAWGAYFACMLRDPTDDTAMKNVKEEAFVPELSLNAHVKKQLQVRIPRQQQYFLLQRNIIQQAVKSLNFSGDSRNF